MSSTQQSITETRIPQLAFLGIGWIGNNRMQSIIKSGQAKACVVADTNRPSLDIASEFAEHAICVNDLNEILLYENLNGIVIATPNFLHAEQSIICLEKGLAVFCQKPLGRNAQETKKVIDTAKKNNLLLGVDLSYRYTDAFQKVFEVIKKERLGKIYSVDLVFHNAFGPGKEWFYDPEQSGGGCVLDLGIHLIDLALYALDFPAVKNIHSSLYSKGEKISNLNNTVEDYASVVIELDDAATMQLKCSWNLPIGQFASIEVSFYGTKGGASIKNINGSYFDFSAEMNNNVTKEIISQPPDDWGSRAALNWIKNLSLQNKFDESINDCIKVAEIIDTIYRR